MGDELHKVDDEERVAIGREIRSANVSDAMVSYRNRLRWWQQVYSWFFIEVFVYLLFGVQYFTQFRYTRTRLSVFPTNTYWPRMRALVRSMDAEGWEILGRYEYGSRTVLLWKRPLYTSGRGPGEGVLCG